MKKGSHKYPVKLIGKTCHGCNTYKKIEQFHKNRTAKDGHQDLCNECKNRLAKRAYIKKKNPNITKIDELLKELYERMRLDAKKLLHSGAIDLESFDHNNYTLAKIIVTAVMRRNANAYQPLHDEHRGTLADLERV